MLNRAGSTTIIPMKQSRAKKSIFSEKRGVQVLNETHPFSRLVLIGIIVWTEVQLFRNEKIGGPRKRQAKRGKIGGFFGTKNHPKNHPRKLRPFPPKKATCQVTTFFVDGITVRLVSENAVPKGGPKLKNYKVGFGPQPTQWYACMHIVWHHFRARKNWNNWWWQLTDFTCKKVRKKMSKSWSKICHKVFDQFL